MNDDQRYLDSLLTHDSKTTLEIYTKFYPKIASFVVNNKGKNEDAQDVFQDALTYLIYISKEKSLAIESFEAYLFTICKNIWKRRLKNKKEWVMKEGVYPLMDKTTHLSSFIVEQQQLELYQEKFAQLSENCKSILALYFNTLDYKDLIQTFSYNSIDVARQRVFKCRKKLIDWIKKDKRYQLLQQ
jgi:DNA-directed RNA polymerase specialized sigma24 family protein